MGETAEPPSLAEKINVLFDRVRKPNGKQYSSAAVAGWCEQRTGQSFSRAYMSYLRNGQRTNPTQQHLAALAEYFDVPPAYFFDDSRSARITAQLELAATLRDGDVHVVALRDLTDQLRDTAEHMSVDDLHLITDMVRSIATRNAANESTGTQS